MDVNVREVKVGDVVRFVDAWTNEPRGGQVTKTGNNKDDGVPYLTIQDTARDGQHRSFREQRMLGLQRVTA